MSKSSAVRARDERFIKAAIAAGVLSKVPVLEIEKRPQHCLLLACGDFVHASDKLTHLWERITPNTHLIMLNGGGLLLDAMSRVNQGSDNVRMVFGQIVGTIRIKAKQGLTINRVYQMVDYDCGVAADKDLTVEEIFKNAINGKAYLKEMLPGAIESMARQNESLRPFLPRKVEVGLLFLVHDEMTDQNTTWYFSSKAMTTFMDTYQESTDSTLAGVPA